MRVWRSPPRWTNTVLAAVVEQVLAGHELGSSFVHVVLTREQEEESRRVVVSRRLLRPFLPCEERLGHTTQAGSHGEHAARQRVAPELLGGHVLPRSGDVEDVQVPTAEDATRRLGKRHLDLVRDPAVGGVAHHSAGAVLHAPDAALAVHREPVRERPAAPVDGRERSPGREGAGIGVEVVGEDRVAEALAEVEGAVVGAPAEPVGATTAPCSRLSSGPGSRR